MVDWNKLRDTSGVLMLLAVASDIGMSVDACLSGTQIAQDELDNPLATISMWQELAVIRNIQEYRGTQEQLGLMVSERCTATALGVFGQALITSETLGQAWKLIEKYQLLGLGFSRFEFSIRNKKLSLTVHDFEMPGDGQRFCEERGLGGCLALFSDLIGRSMIPESVSMRLPAPVDETAYRDFFGVDVEFGAPSTTIVFDRTIEALPLPNANRKLHLASIRYCDEAVESQSHTATFTGRVQALLEEHDLSLSLETVAQHLGISSRQLRRYLADESTSFRTMQLDLKFGRAQSLLDSGMTVNDVAHALGYATQASFSRAFKKHTGKSPSFFKQ